METNSVTSKKSPKKPKRRHTRRNSLQLPKGVRVLLSPRNPYEEFHKLFKGVPKEEFPINDYSCALSRDILLHGRLFASENWLCFYSNIFGFETVVKLECKKIKSITRAKTAYMFPNAILVRTEKKKYLFCSFLTRDSAHKLLLTIWQESVKNNKTDSGVDENANGDLNEDVEETSFDCDPDEEEIAEEVVVLAGKDMTELEEQLHVSKDLVRVAKHHQRTTSCPNTPLAHHPSLQEAIITEHNEQCLAQSHEKQNNTKISRLRRYCNGIIQFVLMLLNAMYNLASSFLRWLLKRNYGTMDVVFVFSTLLLVLLLSTTLTLMNRITKLEQRVLDNKGVHNYNEITDQVSTEHWGNMLRDEEQQFLLKTQRLNQALCAILLSVENVKSKLNMVKNDLTVPPNRLQQLLDNISADVQT